MTRKLAANVFVDGVFYAAGSEPPEDVAAKITNPDAWGDEPEADETEDESEEDENEDEESEEAEEDESDEAVESE